uniref:ANK_REP_REGION domain-containing protein n=1 Tax=Macrostomum lignano TaxID=282301 RepID=A0A1I8F7N6_9PLAT
MSGGGVSGSTNRVSADGSGGPKNLAHTVIEKNSSLHYDACRLLFFCFCLIRCSWARLAQRRCRRRVGLSGSASGRALKSVDLVKEEDNGWSSSVWWWLTTLVNCLILFVLGLCRLSPLPSTVSRSEDPKRHAARLLAFRTVLQPCRLEYSSWQLGSSLVQAAHLSRAASSASARGSAVLIGWAQMGWHLVLAACLQICSLGAAFLPSTVREVRCRCLTGLTIPSIRSSVVQPNRWTGLDLFAGRDPESCWWAATARLAALAQRGQRRSRLDDAGAAAGRFEGRQTGRLADAGARAYRTAVFGLTGTSSAASALAAAEQAADLARLRELLSSSSVPDDGQPQQRLRWMTQAWCLIGLRLAALCLVRHRPATARQPGLAAGWLTAYQSDLRSARDVSLRIGADPDVDWPAHEAALRLLARANPLPPASACARPSRHLAPSPILQLLKDADRKCALVKQLFAAQTAAAAESRLDWIVD